MASESPTDADGGRWSNMSIARFIPRFANPLLLTTHIPAYRHSFSPPASRKQDSTEDGEIPALKQAAVKQDGQAEPAAESTSASYVEWNELLPVPSKLLGHSFNDLFTLSQRKKSPFDSQLTQRTAGSADENADTSPPAGALPPPRLVFFGEQHHQPQVMRAQLQTLHALHQQCQLASKHHVSHAAGTSDTPAAADASATATRLRSSSKPPIYRLHLILEHFSVLDQGMLTSFSQGKLGPDELADAYNDHSEEAFHIGHYMPLLMLAKELQVPIWGGFPPRRWARQVFRDGVEAVKPDEHKRVSPTSMAESSAEAALASGPKTDQAVGWNAPLRSPLFTAWSSVTNISAAHRSYLSGLMRPDLPPRFPPLAECHAERHSTIYPTWLLKPHNVELKGFGPAQALKDSYLAHVTAWILRGATSDTPSTHAHSESSQTARSADSGAALAQSDTEARAGARPVVNIALVVCGLGHCEYGFGAPERVVQLLAQDGSSGAHEATLPYIIASKPLDSGIWLGYEHALLNQNNDSEVVQDKLDADQATALKHEAATPESVQQWLRDPWGRKMADAVLLYDWIGDEPEHQEHDAAAKAKTSANDNAHVKPDAQLPPTT